ncbi:lipase family protein [Streptomyces agglomeratus]|uniref:lipase family protein n=1 Tax=Streptomyces agglomeratus TaxID=285458 RepID=UPI000A89F01A|nr:lipase family protein [Streptomyces agglomeratus]
MRIVLVHGIGQGSSSEDELRRGWTEALAKGCDKAFVEFPESADIRVPFYGKILEDAVSRTPGTARNRGPEDPFDSFEAGLLLEVADRADITEADILAEISTEQQAIERGIEDSRYVQAASRVLIKRFPFIGDEFIRRFFPEAHAYVLWKRVREEINDLLATHLGAGPTVVVGHSLGSVVTYWTLTDLHPPTDVPLMVTLGSPLGFPSIRGSLPKPLAKPLSVKHWLNAADVRDPIALFPRLDREHFPGVEVENLSDLRNPQKDRHGIDGYLSDPLVAKRIVDAVSRS